MNVKVLSDLHLEFEDYDPGTGDVLVLAGDICVAVEYQKYDAFFRKCAEGYNKVFYVVGNHEHYHGNVDNTVEILKKNLPEGITLLDDESEVYRGILFVGTTLWTSFSNGNIKDMIYASESMNDYRVIRNGTRVLEPFDTLAKHDISYKYLLETVNRAEYPVFVITHHSPSSQSFREGYREPDAKYAYVNELESFIKQHPQIQYWAHGHIHESNDYKIRQCRVISNPKGYNEPCNNKDFRSDVLITIDRAQPLPL
tara:strand:- start:83 stop:847 length:765 start_codon:yes stop_codon:yes gene_type:complete